MVNLSCKVALHSHWASESKSPKADSISCQELEYGATYLDMTFVYDMGLSCRSQLRKRRFLIHGEMCSPTISGRRDAPPQKPSKTAIEIDILSPEDWTKFPELELQRLTTTIVGVDVDS